MQSHYQKRYLCCFRRSKHGGNSCATFRPSRDRCPFCVIYLLLATFERIGVLRDSLTLKAMYVDRLLTVYEAVVPMQEDFHECLRSLVLAILVAHYAAHYSRVCL